MDLNESCPLMLTSDSNSLRIVLRQTKPLPIDLNAPRAKTRTSQHESTSASLQNAQPLQANSHLCKVMMDDGMVFNVR